MAAQVGREVDAGLEQHEEREPEHRLAEAEHQEGAEHERHVQHHHASVGLRHQLLRRAVEVLTALQHVADERHRVTDEQAQRRQEQPATEHGARHAEPRVSAGLRAVGQLKQVLAALQVVGVGGGVPIPMIRERIEDGAVVGKEPMTKAVDVMLDDLQTWHEALAPLRGAA